MRAWVLGVIFSITVVPALAGNEDAELDAMTAVDHATIMGVSYLVLCEHALRADYSAVWQINRDRLIRNIGEIIFGEDRALLRFDKLEKSAQDDLVEWEISNPDNSPRISDANLCLTYLIDNEHEVNVAVAKLREIRAGKKEK